MFALADGEQYIVYRLYHQDPEDAERGAPNYVSPVLATATYAAAASEALYWSQGRDHHHDYYVVDAETGVHLSFR